MFKKRNSVMQKFALVLMLLLVFALNAQLLAQQQDTDKPTDVFDMPLEQLMEIEVVSTATLTETKPRLVPSTMTTITAGQIRASGARSLYELLDIYVPNLQWMRHHWENDMLGLRGIISDRNDKYLLLVNGRVLNQHAHFGVISEQDLVVLGDIHHIDVVRGPGSALYGPGAISMVINIVTFNAETFQGTEVTGRMGAVEEFYTAEMRHGRKFDSNDGGIFIYSGIGKYVGASKYDAPQIYPFTFPETGGAPAGTVPGDGTRAGHPMTRPAINRDGADALGHMPPAKLHIQLTKGNLDIWGRYTRGGKFFTWHTESIARAPYGHGDWAWYSKTPPNIISNFYVYQQLTGYIGYKQEITDTLDIDYAFSYESISVGKERERRPVDNYREDNYYAKALLKWLPNNHHKIAFGLEYQYRDFGHYPWSGLGYHPVDRAGTTKSQNPHAAEWGYNNIMPQWRTEMYSFLGEWQWNINDKWTTFLGARLDDHTFVDLMFSPRAALVHTPNEKETYKLMWSRSVRANYENEMKKEHDAGNGNSDPEKLDSVEIRYERQQNKNLDLAASFFVHYNLQAIAYNENIQGCDITGIQREFGFELEADYHTEKSRLNISHGFTKLYSFTLNGDRKTTFPEVPTQYITAKPYGYGCDLTNWPNHITKLTAQHKLNDKWTVDASMRVYWGFPGMKDFDHYYPYSGGGAAATGDPIIRKKSWDTAYRGSYYLDLGLSYKPSKNLEVAVTGYNLLGIFDKDLNKRNYVETKGAGDFRSHAAAVGFSLTYKF